MKYYLGIDPGLGGALALLDCDGKFCELIDLPVKLKYSCVGNTKRIINAVGLENILSAFIAEYGDIEVFLEDIHGRDGFDAAITFSLGETIGAIRSVVDRVGLELNMITPTFWKKYFELKRLKGMTTPQLKELSRQKALSLYKHDKEVQQHLRRKLDHDRAEALLIAKYAVEINRSFIVK